MAEGAQSLRATVEIDGQQLDSDLRSVLEQILVDLHLHLPDAFSLTFRDLDRRVLERARLKIGSKVRISGTELGGQAIVPLIAAEVTAIEADYHPRGSRAIVRGYDASHRMSAGRWTQTYQNAKDSDLARDVAKRYGLEIGTIDDSGPVLPHVSQLNVSDWDFLRARAREIGFEAAVSDGKFHFRKPRPADQAPAAGDYTSGDPLQLVFGRELLEFRPRITAAGQVADVSVRSWDVMTKAAILHEAKASTTSVALKNNPADLAATFGSRRHAVVDRPLATQAEAEMAASALSEAIASTWAEADGVARGNPMLRAGSAVNISVVAECFAGRYTLTRTRHVFDQDGYRTHFVVSGRQERSLLGLTSMGASAGNASGGSQRIYGLVVAIVTGNADPKKLGRVKLKFPWAADLFESDWARMTQFGAGPNSGAVFLPDVGDEVLVGFEHGDVSHPYVLGGLYNGKDKPNLGEGLFDDNGTVKRRSFISRRGHKLIFFDGPGENGVAIISANGQLKLELDERNNEVRIFSGAKVIIEAKGDLALKAGGRMEISAGSALSVRGSTVSIN